MADVAIRFAGDDFEDGPFYLTNTDGWVRVIEWVDSLTAGRFPHLRGLIESGSCEGTEPLSVELATASQLAPEEFGVRAALQALAEQLGEGDADEVAVISDGSADDDGD